MEGSDRGIEEERQMMDSMRMKRLIGQMRNKEKRDGSMNLQLQNLQTWSSHRDSCLIFNF